MPPNLPPDSADLSRLRSLSELRGFLDAFACVNSKTNHGYSFEIHQLSKAGNATETLQKHFSDIAESIHLSRITDWPAELSRAIERWLCAYLMDRRAIGRLTDPANCFSLSDASSRQDLAAKVLQRISSLIQPSAAWKVDLVDKKKFYECLWEDFALEDGQHVLLIHFGVSD